MDLTLDLGDIFIGGDVLVLRMISAEANSSFIGMYSPSMIEGLHHIYAWIRLNGWLNDELTDVWLCLLELICSFCLALSNSVTTLIQAVCSTRWSKPFVAGTSSRVVCPDVGRRGVYRDNLACWQSCKGGQQSERHTTNDSCLLMQGLCHVVEDLGLLDLQSSTELYYTMTIAGVWTGPRDGPIKKEAHEHQWNGNSWIPDQPWNQHEPHWRLAAQPFGLPHQRTQNLWNLHSTLQLSCSIQIRWWVSESGIRNSEYWLGWTEGCPEKGDGKWKQARSEIESGNWSSVLSFLDFLNKHV